MAQLIVRNLDDDLVEALKARARAHGRSAEAEHREILRAALRGPAAGATFWDWLRSMPDVGDDEDFARDRDLPRELARRHQRRVRAATALVNGLALVTRNVADVARTGVRVFDPFRPER